MAHLSNGHDVDQNDWNAQDDRITNLEDVALTAGGTVGSASLDPNVGWKESSGTLSANGRVTVTHGLGWTPAIVLCQMRGTSGPYGTYVISPTSTIFTVQFYSLVDGGTGTSGQTVTFDWIAFKAASS